MYGQEKNIVINYKRITICQNDVLIKDMAKQNTVLFNVSFFKITKGADVINDVFDNVDVQTKFNKDNKKFKFDDIDINLLKNKDFVVGDLQRIHDKDLPHKIIENDDGTITKDLFKDNEWLGYNNCFAYCHKTQILALQNNAYGVGYKNIVDIFNDIKDNPKEFRLSSQCDDIELMPVTFDKTVDDIDNFKNIQFCVSQLNVKQEWMYFNEFKTSKAKKITILLENKEGFLDKEDSKKIINNVKENFSPSILKTSCLIGGEDVELNFLLNRAKKSIELECKGKTLDYNTRKITIIELLGDFLCNYIEK